MVFSGVVAVSLLLYRCTARMRTKHIAKNIDGNYSRIFSIVLNDSWKQHPVKHQLYSLMSPIKQPILVRRKRYAGQSWKSKDELINDVSNGLLHKDMPVLAGFQRLSYIGFVTTLATL